MIRRTVPALAAALAGALLLGGCSGSSSDTAGASDAGGSTTLTVFAAASLKSSFEEIATDFEADHPGVDVQLSFAGSSDLVTQIGQGAPADVLATADTATMDQAVEQELVTGTPQDFATNTLTIAVPAGNPAGITDLASLAEPGVQLVLCAPQVPCGRAAQKVEESAGVTLSPVSEEQSVTDVLGKVTSGEADAGLVYVTDAASAGDAVEQIDLPEAKAAVNTYPLAVVAGTSQEELATEFTQEVLGERGQEVLAAQGFQAP
ncbi:molybdate ABC transporter substrate-binding protein [Brachybacterium horti]